MSVDGLLLIDKPSGWTSFDVVAKIRGQVKAQTGLKRPKVGHAGTLDPLATGLLLILVGDYCKKASEYSKLDKTYEVELILGKTSTTDDAEGEITLLSDTKPTETEVLATLQSFIGEIDQVPPIFSAIKVDGKRAYKLAREGKQPKMKARPVTIHAIDNVTYDYPKVRFTTGVSSGTYIRSLVRDIGQNLGTGAYMTALQRTSTGDFKLENAHQIDTIMAGTIDQHFA